MRSDPHSKDREAGASSRAGRIALALMAAALFVYVAFIRPATTVVAADGAGEPEVLAVTFASAWCAPCRILKPTLARVAPRFADEPVRFFELDYSFGNADSARARAAEEGVGDIAARMGGATGFTMLVDRDTGEVIDTLYAGLSPTDMAARINAALAVARATPRASA
ncbi:MAG: thioredoxin [Alphaproteobacteria bacterium]|nr:thioredoxin [Alphaproteobacteria bacterium]